MEPLVVDLATGVVAVVGALSEGSTNTASTMTEGEAPSRAQLLKSHGNKLDDKPAERYTLKDRQSGKVVKHGETTRGEDKYGPGKQKRYSKKQLKDMNADYQKENSGTKKGMHKEQHEEILKHKNNNGGERPKYNKNDY